MKKSEKGFSAIEVLIVLVIVSLIGTAGWYVLRQKYITNKAIAPHTSSLAQATTYNFTELGISMKILPGWKVARTTSQQEDATIYSWMVQKPGADGKIEVSSSVFAGGFAGCEKPEDLLPARIHEVSHTQNESLLFLSWSYEDNYETGIVRSDETFFRPTPEVETRAINTDLKAGDYFFCITEPFPGFFLKLNKEEAPGYERRDSIRAVAGSSSNDAYVPLPPSAQSLSDIKTMLTSIK